MEGVLGTCLPTCEEFMNISFLIYTRNRMVGGRVLGTCCFPASKEFMNISLINNTRNRRVGGRGPRNMHASPPAKNFGIFLS